MLSVVIPPSSASRTAASSTRSLLNSARRSALRWVRVAGFGLRPPKNPVLGTELAGIVQGIGKDVTTLRAGDEVFGVGAGSFAEYAVARADQLAPKPANLTFEQAAAVGVSGSTALQAVRDQGHVKAAQDVLILGA